MADGPSSLHNICGVSPKVRAFVSCDLDSHVSFIRKSLAEGRSSAWIAEKLGCKPGRINYYAKKMRMARKCREIPSQRVPKSCAPDGTGPISSPKFKAREL